MSSHMLSLTLSGLGLTDQDVHHLPRNLGHNLDTVGVAFSTLTDNGLDTLLTLAPELISLDLEGNEIKFTPTSAEVDRLWRAEGRLIYLNASCNHFTIFSYIHFLWMAGRSCLETLDVAASDLGTDQALVRLLLFVLRNRSLQRLDMQGIHFCSGEREELGLGWLQGELAPGSVIGRTIASHPSLRTILLAPGTSTDRR